MTHLQLPAPVAGFVAAANRFDLDGLVAVFAADGMVNDQSREFRGPPAIRAWAAREMTGDRVTLRVIEAIRHETDVTVRAEIDGDYDKTGLPDPLVLSFYFTLRGSRIGQLIILHNKSN